MSQSKTIVVASVMVFLLAVISSMIAICLQLFVGVNIIWLVGLFLGFVIVFASAIENGKHYRESFIIFLMFSIINFFMAVLGACLAAVVLVLIFTM